MPLSIALNSDIHLKSVPTTHRCVWGGCVLVLCFGGADLTLRTSSDAVLPAGVPWPACRKMFLRTQREIVWKTQPALPQGHSFPWEKCKGWGGKMAHFLWLPAGGWHFHKQESLKQPELLLKPSLCGTSVVVKWLQWKFMEKSLALGLSQGFWKPCVLFLLLVSFWRSFSESVSPWQVQRYFRDAVRPSQSRSGCSFEPTQGNYGGNWV